MKLAIVGASGGTNIGASLQRAALGAGHEVLFFDAARAHAGPRALRSLAWRIARRPLRLRSFSRAVVDGCRAGTAPRILIATGAAALTAESIARIRSLDVYCVNYSTDDPWSEGHRAAWHLRALPAYHAVCTPRRANTADFAALGCRKVVYLPFGYDESLFPGEAGETAAPAVDVLFVGGADPDRVDFITRFMRHGPPPALVGDYWERHASTRPHALGHKAPGVVAALTRAAKVNLCLVRRSNRDGHVMRSLEMGAIGACILAEDTGEHRKIFGPDGECVCYFRSPEEAALRARSLLADETERRRLGEAVRRRIAAGRHTYGDRLSTMIALTQDPAAR